MKHFISLSILVLFSLFLTSNVIAQSQPVESKSVTCSNSVCERTTIDLKIGEEKTTTINGTGYRFKLDRIVKVPRKSILIDENGSERTEEYFSYDVYVSVNGKPAILSDKVSEELGFDVSINYNYEEGKDPSTISIYISEDKVCMVPDCGFRVEHQFQEKWNLVPGYFFVSEEKLFNKGTCRVSDFKVIWGYNNMKREYTKVFSGLTANYSDFKKAFENLQSLPGKDSKLLYLTPLNSYWVYSKNKCSLVSELPSAYENFISYFSSMNSSTNYSLLSGWNFWFGDQANKGKPLEEIKGTCEIEKAYKFNASNQQWEKTSSVPGFEEALLFKAKNSCMLKEKETIPPSLPV